MIAMHSNPERTSKLTMYPTHKLHNDSNMTTFGVFEMTLSMTEKLTGGGATSHMRGKMARASHINY